MFNAFDVHTVFFVSVGTFDRGFAIDHPIFIVELDPIPICCKKYGLARRFVILIITHFFATVLKYNRSLAFYFTVDVSSTTKR